MDRHALPTADPEWDASEQYCATAGVAWVVVVAAAALDVATTLIGLAAGLPELNPVATTAVAAVGAESALVGLKLAALGVVAAGWRATPPPSRLAVPASVGLLWSVVGLLNVVALALD